MMKTDLRILLVMDAIQGRNGVGTYFQDLADHLQPRVERVELVAPRLGQPHPCQGASLPMPGDPTQRVYLPRMRRLTQLAVAMRPHVIVVPGPGVFALAGFWLASKLGIPVCLTHQTDYSQLVNLYWRGITGRFAQTMLAWTNLLMFRGSSSVATISESLVQQLRQQGIGHPFLVGTSLAPEFIDAPIQEPRAHVRRILFVGRLAAEKNLHLLLELATQRPDLQFSIVGDGPQRPQVENQARQCHNLAFLGWCSRTVVREQLDAHDLLMLPSAVEAFGTVALEAMARKRLVVTAPGCGINQWRDLAAGLVSMDPAETLGATLQRIEQWPATRRLHVIQRGHQAALALNNATLEQWLSVLSLTAAKAHSLPRPMPSATFALLRRLAAFQS
ncbi:MAG: glycosyltransferase [Pseudomonadota bacterium]|nr:glycosyltransferase [Pseudomonadota bacterium]